MKLSTVGVRWCSTGVLIAAVCQILEINAWRICLTKVLKCVLSNYGVYLK